MRDGERYRALKRLYRMLTSHDPIEEAAGLEIERRAFGFGLEIDAAVDEVARLIFIFGFNGIKGLTDSE